MHVHPHVWACVASLFCLFPLSLSLSRASTFSSSFYLFSVLNLNVHVVDGHPQKEEYCSVAIQNPLTVSLTKSAHATHTAAEFLLSFWHGLGWHDEGTLTAERLSRVLLQLSFQVLSASDPLLAHRPTLPHEEHGSCWTTWWHHPCSGDRLPTFPRCDPGAAEPPPSWQSRHPL